MAFDNLYCIAFQMMDAQWLAMRASYMEFNVKFPVSIFVHWELQCMFCCCSICYIHWIFIFVSSGCSKVYKNTARAWTWAWGCLPCERFTGIQPFEPMMWAKYSLSRNFSFPFLLFSFSFLKLQKTIPSEICHNFINSLHYIKKEKEINYCNILIMSL